MQLCSKINSIHHWGFRVHVERITRNIRLKNKRERKEERRETDREKERERARKRERKTKIEKQAKIQLRGQRAR